MTFCFTDIEDSTKLFARLGERYGALLAEHLGLIHDAAAPLGGVDVKTEGDGCFLAFQDALSAVKAAGAMQQAVDGHGWPDGARIRIRVGVHTGDAQPSGRDYVALAVHQAARVADTGHGGQVIVSAATAALLEQDSLAPFHLADLGEYRLRSFEKACCLYQLAGPGLAGAFPPLRTRTAINKRVRIFLSSPGDVRAAREIAALTIERLAQDYARFFAVEPYFWDYEAMLAAGRFQDPEESPSAFDIVVLIVWSRLGKALPERTAIRAYRGIDDRAPLTGTEWEFEEALKASRERGAPDLLIYRSVSPASFDLRDAKLRDQQLQQIASLDAFCSKHFANQGWFTGSFTEFTNHSEFADALEKQLRWLIDKRIGAEDSSRGDQAVKVWIQAPFRGLECYNFEHAPIFFGQDEALTKAMVQLVANAEAGSPFLLVLGASGAGKSSLVKAGIVPKLFVPRRIPGAAFLRRVMFRPSDAQEGEDLFDALARRLTTQIGPAEGLSELIGPGQLVASLAAHLRNASTEPGYPIGTALAHLAAAARRDGRMLKYESAKLLLVVDQLEELFTNERIRLEERQRFVDLLAGLVRSGLVWVIATMRKDFWHHADDTPNLVQMVEDNGRLELLPPTQLQLSQMIRRPAAAAGIGFERHKTTDAPLNEVIAEEVAYAPGALPLLSYLMDQLYRSDVLEAHGTTLTFATYERLGRLEGAIATKAEAVLEACAPDDRQALGSVLFALVQMSTVDGDIERAVSRRVQLANFPRGTPQHNLIEALLHPDARLLVSDAEPGGHPTVRLAHEALITRWERARDFVQGNAQALKIRRRIEERYALWRGLVAEATADTREPKHLRARLAARRARFEREKGLLTEIDLIDGQRLLREHRTDTEPQLVDYIERSEADDIRIRGRAVRVLTGVASVVTVLALLASAAGLLALQKQHEAESQTQKTLEAQSRSLIQAAAERLQNADVSGAQGIILEVLANRSINPVDRAAAIDVFQDARAADTQLAVLSGHDKSVYSSNYSPDHRHIVTASNDGTARIWDASSGAQLAILSGHVAGVTNAAYSPDGKHIVTASYDKTARIWDASSGAQVAVLSGHQDAVWSAAYSPDGGRIVTASFDGTARIWDTGNSTQIMVLSGHHDPIVYAAWSPDGKRVVTASEDKTARIWDATTGGQLVVLSGHGSIVTTAAFSPDGNRVVTASEDKTARVWDARTGAQLVVISGHKGEVYWAAWSPDGARIATASIDKTARIWDAGTGAQVALLSGHHEQIFWTAWSPDGTRVTTASSDRTARIWDARKSSKLPVLAGDDNFVYSAAYSPDGKRIVTASDDGTLHIWDATTGARLSVLTGHGGTIRTVAWSPDGSRIVSASDDKTARIWDAAKGTQLLLLSGFGNELKSAAFSPDGRRVITASNDGTARIWDARTRARLVTLKGHGDRVSDAAWSPDGKRIVTASYDKTARIWDAETGAQLAALVGHGGYVNSAAWSPDGKRILTASNDKTARIWDVAGGAQLAVLSGGDGEIARASWSPNGTRIVTASSDGTARIWNAVTGLQLAVLAGHADRVSDAEWSPDGRRIVTTSYDKTARIWDAEIPANLDAQITWSQAAQIDSLSDVERARLGLTPDLRLKTWPNSSGKCDSEAAAPYDPDRLAPGVMRDDISAEVATRACADEIAETGNSPRRHYESGRALFAKHDLRGAKRELELAVSQGYRSAQIDLAELLVDPSDEMLAPARAATLYEKAWQDGVPIAAFKLGQLYAHGVRDAHTAKKIGLAPDSAKAWMWYQKGADIGEPNALAKFAEREDANAVAEQLPAKKDALLLAAFSFYTAAAKQAHDEDWPDNEWKTWHYRRATLARLLAREGLMLQVAEAFAQVQQRWSPQPPTPLERVARWLHL